MISKLAAFVRGLAIPVYGEAREDVQPHINTRGEILTSEGLPPLVEIVRQGSSWQGATRTGQAALTVLPTTVAGLSLFNAYKDDGPHLIIEEFGSWEAVVDATQTDVTALFAMLNDHADAAPSAGTDEAVTVIRSISGRANYDGPNVIKRGGTVVDAGWFAHPTEGPQMAAAPAGANWKVNACRVRGLYIVPPGAAFNVQAVKAAAAAAAQQFFYVRWHEAILQVQQ